MLKTLQSMSLSFVIFLTFSYPTMASLGHSLDSVKANIERRIKDVYQAKLDAKHRQQALTQLRNIQSRYNTARSLSAVSSQKDAAQDMANQIKRDLSNFDKRLNSYLISSQRDATAKEGS